MCGVLSWLFTDTHKMLKIGDAHCTCLTVNKVVLCLLIFSSCAVSKCPFYDLLVALFSAFLCFLLVISPFKMALKCSTKVLCYVLKHENFDTLSSPKFSFLN